MLMDSTINTKGNVTINISGNNDLGFSGINSSIIGTGKARTFINMLGVKMLI